MRLKICRLCKSDNLKKFLDLGKQPPSDAFLTKSQLSDPEMTYPLRVFLCVNCGQVQLGDVIPPEILYRRNYPYESSTTRTGREHFFDFANKVIRRFKLKPSSLVVDIGSNVGLLLKGFKNQAIRVLGIDPASDIVQIAIENGIKTIDSFFTSSLASQLVEIEGKASVITATNVFAHIDDLDDCMKGVTAFLKEDGVFIIEFPHFLELVKGCEYDTIYHEHLSYLSIKPLTKFFAGFGMEIFDVERYPIHGGTLRVFVSRKHIRDIKPVVSDILNEESNSGIHTIGRLNEFAREVKIHREQLRNLLLGLKGQGKVIVGISAPAKGNTLLNYCKIDNKIVDYITEKASIKIGLFTPGTRIPICSDSKLFDSKPDYALILAWNFADEIISNLSKYHDLGGKFIIPIPNIKIV